MCRDVQQLLQKVFHLALGQQKLGDKRLEIVPTSSWVHTGELWLFVGGPIVQRYSDEVGEGPCCQRVDELEQVVVGECLLVSLDGCANPATEWLRASWG